MCSGSVAGHSLISDWEEDVCGEIVLWSMCHCAAVTREKITAKTELTQFIQCKANPSLSYLIHEWIKPSTV